MSDSTGFGLRWMAGAVVVCSLLMLPMVWDGPRGWIFPDTISYLDMASGAIQDSPALLLKNAYWSPAYPATLALMMAVIHPSLTSELQTAYVVHWLLFLGATLCFSLLMATVLEWLRRNSWPELASDGALLKALILFGYAFLVVANTNRTMWYLTPDMLLQGVIYLSAAWAVRLFLPDSSWKHSAALGLSLGLGYLAKAAMFPVALILIGILFLKPPKDRLGRRHSFIAMGCFWLVAAPLVGLSSEKHRFTFGDSGKLNYAWFVNEIPSYAGWIGQYPGIGTPTHPPRQLMRTPLTLEFHTPVRGTQPLWYDASYWWEGLRVPFSPRSQFKGILQAFTHVHSRQTILLALAAALVPLCLLSVRVRKAIRAGGVQIWILTVWPLSACLMYAMVLFNFRYVVGYLVLACVGIATLVLQPFQGATRTRVLYGVALLLALSALVRVGPVVQAVFRGDSGGSLTREEGRDNGPSSEAVAEALGRLGIRPGDEIGAIGHSLDCYYARLAGVRIVTQIWDDPEQVAALSAPKVREIVAQLKLAGVKALVSRAKPGFVNDEGWVGIPRTDVYVRML